MGIWTAFIVLIIVAQKMLVKYCKFCQFGQTHIIPFNYPVSETEFNHIFLCQPISIRNQRKSIYIYLHGQRSQGNTFNLLIGYPCKSLFK